MHIVFWFMENGDSTLFLPFSLSHIFTRDRPLACLIFAGRMPTLLLKWRIGFWRIGFQPVMAAQPPTQARRLRSVFFMRMVGYYDPVILWATFPNPRSSSHPRAKTLLNCVSPQPLRVLTQWTRSSSRLVLLAFPAGKVSHVFHHIFWLHHHQR